METTRVVFLYLVFGQEKFFLESKLSIASILSYCQQEPFDFQIVVYSDQPEFYQHEKVVSIAIDNQTIKDWSGQIGYVYRSKIMCLEDCCSRYSNDIIIMMDTDTVFKCHPKYLIQNIKPSQSVMHFNEGKPSGVLLSILDKKEIKRILSLPKQQLSGNIWNSGVIGIHPQNSHLVTRVKEFNDAFYRLSGYFATEQYAFSTVLEGDHKLVDAFQFVFHYWHKTYKDNFYKKADNNRLAALSLNSMIGCYKDFIPTWPFRKNIGLRIRALIYFLFRFNRFRVYYSMFA